MAKYIPEEHYKGVHDSKEECPLAFITPYGTDKAAKQRMRTVDEWSTAGLWSKPKNPKTEVIKNEAVSGFRISEEIRRWSTSNVVWRIVDPRGFQLEISSGNMAYLIAETSIHEGWIDATLQWVRDGAQNYLLPVSSNEHKTYTLNTVTLNNKMGIKDITIGDHIHTLNGTDGIYLGGYYLLDFHGFSYEEKSKFIGTSRRYFIKNLTTNKISLHSTLKGLSIIEANKEENKDWSSWINSMDDERYRYVSKKKPNVKAIAETAKFIPSNKSTLYDYLVQIADGSVYEVCEIFYGYSLSNKPNSEAGYNSIIIDKVGNTFQKSRVDRYGSSRHSMSTFGLTNMFKSSDKIEKLIAESGVAVKLTVTIEGNELTLMG